MPGGIRACGTGRTPLSGYPANASFTVRPRQGQPPHSGSCRSAGGVYRAGLQSRGIAWNLAISSDGCRGIPLRWGRGRGRGGKTERWQGPGAQPPVIPVGDPDGSSVLPGAAELGVLGYEQAPGGAGGGPGNGKPGEPGLPEASCNPGGGLLAAVGPERKGLQKGRSKPRMCDTGWRRLLRVARDGAVTGTVTVSGRVRPGECRPDGR